MNYQSLLITSAQHSVCFSTGRLAIHENGGIFTFQEFMDDLFAGLWIHLGVVLILGEYMIVGELVYVGFLYHFGMSSFHAEGRLFIWRRID